jgi:catecholate siderophore receptor
MQPDLAPSRRRNAARTGAHKAANALAICMAAHGLGSVAHAAVDDADSTAPVLLSDVVVNDQSVTSAVTSPKFTEPVVDTPQTVNIITPEVYQAQSATTLSDVLKNTPGITFFAGEGGSANRTGGDSFYLRGFDTSNSIFIDGVREEGAVTHDVFDVGQVEIFKGPSSENGRGGTAGYIDLETKLPTTTGFEDLQYLHTFSAEGSRNNDRWALDLDAPVAASPVAGTAVRLNLLDQQGGVPGRMLAENNRWGLAPSLALGLGTPTRVFLTYEHLYEHNLPDYGLPSTILPGFAPAALGLYSPGIDTANYYGFASFDYEHVNSDTLTARLEHDFSGGAKLSNQMRSDSNTRKVESTSPQSNATTPAGEVALTHGIYDTKNEILSNQTNFSDQIKTGSVVQDLTTGLELSREVASNPIWAVVPFGAASPNYLVSIYQPANFPTALYDYAPHKTGATTDTRINTTAAYVFDTIKLNKYWELTGGLRVEHYNVNELSITPASPTIPVLAAQPATATTLPTAATTAVAAVPASSGYLTAGKTTVAGRGGLVFKPAANGSIYASCATSVRPPGASGATNTLSTTTSSVDDPLLQPEKTIDYEAGTKWQFFDNRLLASAAVFRSVNTNVPAADPTTGLVDQTSDQTVNGVELSVSGKITEQWLILAGYAHMKAKVSQQISTNAQGLTLPLLPQDSGNLWTTYALPHGLGVGIGTQYMGATERLQATNAPTSTTFANGVPSYWVSNAMISYTVNPHLSFRLNVNNLADKEYIISLNNNGYRLNLGAPRSFILSAELKF